MRSTDTAEHLRDYDKIVEIKKRHLSMQLTKTNLIFTKLYSLNRCPIRLLLVTIAESAKGKFTTAERNYYYNTSMKCRKTKTSVSCHWRVWR